VVEVAQGVQPLAVLVVVEILISQVLQTLEVVAVGIIQPLAVQVS
jgi:hypothetical protein